ncbi:VanZ family protein [Peribacillus sp. NPDC096540]|uniref:VanZ family protein n=1 Tax=Peribacillus sp. NPDC096540 TaxID=3390612 RepID=UPI003D00B49C
MKVVSFFTISNNLYEQSLIKRINKVSIFSIAMIILLFVIEVIQIVIRRGSFDIDDFILNMLGALIGFGLSKMKFVQKLLKYNRGDSSFADKSL